MFELIVISFIAFPIVFLGYLFILFLLSSLSWKTKFLIIFGSIGVIMLILAPFIFAYMFPVYAAYALIFTFVYSLITTHFENQKKMIDVISEMKQHKE